MIENIGKDQAQREIQRMANEEENEARENCCERCGEECSSRLIGDEVYKFCPNCGMTSN